MKKLTAIILALAIASAAYAEQPAMAPSPKDKCPVCGMFVAKYTDWLCMVTLASGAHRYFDGPKDMFRYINNPLAFEPGVKPSDISLVMVREYYDLKEIDGRKAFYVTGSDVLGPMGHEAVPFKSRADADEFMRDHKGKRVLSFDEVTPKVIEALN